MNQIYNKVKRINYYYQNQNYFQVYLNNYVKKQIIVDSKNKFKFYLLYIYYNNNI